MPRQTQKQNYSQRCTHPAQQQGRRMPSRSSSHVLLIRRILVSVFFADITQQINSLRASGVMSSHNTRTDESAARAFRKSAGMLCATPPAISCLAIYLYFIKLSAILAFRAAILITSRQSFYYNSL